MAIGLVGRRSARFGKLLLFNFQWLARPAASAVLLRSTLRVRLDRDHGFQSIVIINSRAS